jgi:hypothetical protein
MQNADKYDIAYRVGRLFLASPTTSGTPVTAISPSSNTTGAVIRTLMVDANHGAPTFVYADTAPPAPGAGIDVTKRIIFAVAAQGSTDTFYGFPYYPLYLDPGIGVYVVSLGVDSFFAMTWDLV